MAAEHQQLRPWRRRASDGVDSSRARMDNDWGQRASKKRQPVHRRLALLQDPIGPEGERDIKAANNVHYERHGTDGHMEHSASPSSSHTPIKVAGHGTYQQLQRKRMKPSILSRIQYNSLPLPSTPPNSQFPCEPMDGDSSNASQKGKDYSMFPSSSGGEDGLDGAVQLDVSFRSDSLVAKEILDSSGPSDKQDSSLIVTVNGGLVRPNNTPAHTENRLTGKKSPAGPSQGPNLSSPSSGGKAKVPVKKVIKKLVKRKRIVKKMVPRSKACGGPANSQASSHGTVIHNDSMSPLVHERNSSLPEEPVVPDSALPVVATNHTSPPVLSCLQGVTAVQTPGGLEPEESFEIAATHGAHSSGDDNLKDEPTVMPEEDIALQVHLNVALAESNEEPILLSSYGNLSPANQSGINEQQYAGRHEGTAFSHTYGKEVEAPPFSNLDVQDTVSSQVSPLRATDVNENLGLPLDKDWPMPYVDCPPPNVESAIVPMDIKEVMVPGAEVVNAEWPSFPSSDKEAQSDYSDLDEKHLGDVLPLDASGPSLVQSETEAKSYETTTTDCTFLDKTSVLLPSQRVSSIAKYNIEVKSYETTSSDCILLDKASMLLRPQQMEPSTMDSTAKGIGFTNFRDHKTSGIPKFSAHQESLGSGPSKVPLSSNQTTRNRTWHRTGSPLPSSPTRQDSGCPLGGEVPKRSGRAQSAYVRKGNSLVRKPAAAVPLSQRSSVPVATAVHQINITKSDGLNNKSFKDNVHGVDKAAALGKSGPTPLGKTKYPILPFSSKPFTSTEDPQNCHLYGSQNTLTKTGSEIFMQATERLIKPKTLEDIYMHVGPLENQPADVLAGSTETPIISDDGNSKSSNANKVIYVKRKSNQLVATPGPELHDSTGHNTKKSGYKPSTELSDKYYRKNKNQLVRNAKPSEVLIGQPTPIPGNDPCLEGQTAPKHFPPECSQSKRRDKAIEKMHKHSKSSLVWTLSGKQSYNRDHSTLKCRKVIPYLFPWKINTNWRRFLSNRASFSKKSPLSFIRNMQLVQKRGTIYTVSTGGFSLRKSGVLSIGGSSLKWSKSIEKRSKKTSEVVGIWLTMNEVIFKLVRPYIENIWKEATLAVVEAERKKKELKGSVHVNQKKVSRISCRSACGIKLNQGERIFRVGSIRYKMDSSKRTLIRIPVPYRA
ncbi:Zinc finger CCCH domain-containing protein 7 [Acorus gramineus]|uniref:Zinc finger CCCH domain-containing protein 7 n=1 Tax=Acorus gramineus TaxID=55184 RepID=A0AAV9AHA5_ACOGR|nr:Zinc finger CCCH domain-containing protein 7 [Acorus gramineus]